MTRLDDSISKNLGIASVLTDFWLRSYSHPRDFDLMVQMSTMTPRERTEYVATRAMVAA